METGHHVTARTETYVRLTYDRAVVYETRRTPRVAQPLESLGVKAALVAA